MTDRLAMPGFRPLRRLFAGALLLVMFVMACSAPEPARVTPDSTFPPSLQTADVTPTPSVPLPTPTPQRDQTVPGPTSTPLTSIPADTPRTLTVTPAASPVLTATVTPTPSSQPTRTPTPTATPETFSGENFTLVIPAEWEFRRSPVDDTESPTYALQGRGLFAQLGLLAGEHLEYQTPEVYARLFVNSYNDLEGEVTEGPRTVGSDTLAHTVRLISEEGTRVDFVVIGFGGIDVLRLFVWGDADAFDQRTDAVEALIAGLTIDGGTDPKPPAADYEQSFTTLNNLAYALYMNDDHTIFVQADAPLFGIGNIQAHYSRASETIARTLGFPVLHHPDVYIVREAEMSRYAAEQGLPAPIFTAGLRSEDGTFVGPTSFSDSTIAAVLTHELAHDVIDTIDPLGALSVWLNEGFAGYAGLTASAAVSGMTTPEFLRGRLRAIEAALEEDTLLTLEELRDWKWTTQTPGDEVTTVYAQSWAFIKYIGDTHGNDAVRDLLWNTSAGATFEAAMTIATGQQHPNETVWAPFIDSLPALVATNS